jgi:hypothetical protein
MNIKNIKLFNYYRVRGSDSWWAKPVKILKPKEGINTTNKYIAECEWSSCKNAGAGVIKYFALSALINPAKGGE